MKVALDGKKSVEENAGIYFENAKKAKKKLEGAKRAYEETLAKIRKADDEEKKVAVKFSRKKEWYERFRWFYTSEGRLFIAGRDATTNEIVIKKHSESTDIVFHSELPSSPFGVLKEGGNEQSVKECAIFIGTYSKAWKSGRTVADVFYVQPEQVTKEAPSGEFIGKGSFMVYGKKTILSVELELYIGTMADRKVMAGPLSAVKKHCSNYVRLIPGNDKISAIAKAVKKRLDAPDLDEIMRLIPQGSSIEWT